MKIILKTNTFIRNLSKERIVKVFLLSPKTLVYETRKFGIAYILQYYQYDNGYSSGVYTGWRWRDIAFEKELYANLKD